MPSPQTLSQRRSRVIALWLGSICFMVLGMVLIGGITRLTGSGLSITEWKPIMGAIPPLNEAQWLEAFGKYQQIPQYKIINHGMSLGEFKWIFFWEYLHRLFGRSIALVYVIPWIVLGRRGWVTRALHRRLALGIALFMGQGLMGWIMVASGLSERTSVSHYRLAAHLSLALVTLGYMLWVIRQELPLSAAEAPVRGRTLSVLRALLAIVSVQIVYGAFMAGLKAGHMYWTFPKMNGEWLPQGAFELAPAWVNFLENPATVHFMHRTLGWGVLAGLALLGWALATDKMAPASARRRGFTVVAIGCAQFLLGVATVLSHVAIPVAVVHQIGGTLLLGSLLWALYAYARPIAASAQADFLSSELSCSS